MSVSLSAERDRIQRQVEELEQSLSATHTELELLSSETGDESDDEDEEEEEQSEQNSLLQCESAAGLLAQREKIQKEIQNLENVLGPHSPIYASDDDDDASSSDESELGLSLSVGSCLQMNLVYQQVVQETLDQLETLLTHNQKQQKEVVSQLSGPVKESPRERCPPSSCQQPFNMFLGRFLKPYFKDKLTGLGPPANQETKEKANRMAGCLDNNKLKLKRWESWQKTLLIHSVARDSLRKLIQPKLSKVDYLTQKLSSAVETDRQQLREQIDSLEREIDLLRGKKEEELIGDRYEEHDWQKISNIDFEATRDADDIRCFWQNFLHPSINKTRWSQEEVQQLKEISMRHGERHWETIAAELGTGRTAFLCLQTYQRFVSASLRHSSWTPAEDALLRELVDKMRIGNFIPYTQISYFMEGRDPAQVIYRWCQVLDPSLKKGPWTKQEDELLMRAVSLYGEGNWWRIRLEVPGRTDSACRDRYLDTLKVETKKGPFDKQEREQLLQLVEKHGVGRWARIAAEIPHRNDAQCLREWRKMSKICRTPPPQKSKKGKKTPQSRGRGTKKKNLPTKRTIKRRLMKLKEEEEEERKEEEQMELEYMDSDDEKKKEVVEVEKIEEVEKEEEYTFPLMQEWIPIERAEPFSFLTFRPVEMASSADAPGGKRARSTVLGQFGRSVIIGPEPRELPGGKHHSLSTMMMVSADQLRAHLQRQAQTFNDLSSTRSKVQTVKRRQLGQTTEVGLRYELQAAVTPWIGNLLIPAKTRLTVADALREQQEKTQLSSTAVFLLLLQTMKVDVVGCKEMIEQRRSRGSSVTPPPDPATNNPRNIARPRQQREARDGPLQLDMELILNQLQALQQQDKHNRQQQQQRLQQLLLLQQPPPRLPSLPPPLGILPQMLPNMHPGMSPMSSPQAVFIPHPVTQPRGASIQLMPPRFLTAPPPGLHTPPAGVVTCPFPALPAPHRLPPVSVVPVPLNTTSACSASSPQPAGPQNLIVTLPGSLNHHVPIGSTPASQLLLTPSNASGPITCPGQPHPAPSPSTSIPKPLEGRGQQVAEDPEASSGQSGELLNRAVNGVDRKGEGIEEGRRILKTSLTLQEVTESKAEAGRAQIQNTACTALIQLVPQTPPTSATMSPTPPQRPPPAGVDSSPLTRTDTPSHAPLLIGDTTPPAAALRLNATPARSDRTVSSTQNFSLAPPPSKPTNQPSASSTSGHPAPLHSDHNYTISCYPTNSHHGSTSVKQRPAPKRRKPRRRKSDSTPKKPPKAPPKGRKRARVEEQQSVTSSQENQCVGRTGDGVGGTGDGGKGTGDGGKGTGDGVGGTGDGVGGTGDGGKGTGVIQEGKRVRKPSQRARAVQEAVQEKAEAKMKRTSSSSPCKKRSRLSRSKQEVVVQNPPVLPGFCLLPGQSMWVMTPGGLVQLAEGLPQGLRLAFVPSTPLPAQHGNILTCHQATPPVQSAAGPAPIILPGLNQPQPLPAPPTCPSKPLPPASTLKPPPKTVSAILSSMRTKPGVDPVAPPRLRREALEFDPALMFLESPAEVRDWLSGRGGVGLPGVDVTLPYLPPFVSSLNTLSALLRVKKALTKSCLQLLCRGSEPHRPRPRPDSSAKRTPSTDLPDSTSDLRPAADKPSSTSAPAVSSTHLEEEEAELVATVRQLVAERFSDNPAYQLLKIRFLSCFTVPALLATMQPITNKTVTRPSSEEEEMEEVDDEEEELKNIKERGRRRKAERSLLLRDGSGAPANHFSGINTSPPSTDLDQITLDRTAPDRTTPVFCSSADMLDELKMKSQFEVGDGLK
ncbi:snRNA-activating protein complex subunit 4 isoform X1 [Micropterus salmoides]|uniref:snRNA-activating protein complex subunit 4 isoform X1 n=1 Tax=Micropterus salmoides TaxID=27706 RepID=UPI0018EBAB44|nr:snRNA-activating protein complex subunit 4 isoform X1 [Micropterus salmoides]